MIVLNKEKGNIRRYLGDIVYDVVGSLFFAVGLSCFSAPSEIAPGGVSGIAVILNYLFGLPLGMVTMAINIPLLLLAWFFLGKDFTVKTLKSVLILTIMLDYVAPYFPIYKGEYILAALFGGLGIGVGLAIIFMRGSTTGGTDILSRLIQRRYRHVPIGKVMMGIDVVVLICSMMVFHNIEAGLYGLICIFASAKALDSILYGMDNGKVLLVFSSKVEEMSKKILVDLYRGVTFLRGVGAYSGEERQVMLCAVRSNEYHKAEEIIKEFDPEAFVITLEAGEIQGYGFRYLTEEKVT